MPSDPQYDAKIIQMARIVEYLVLEYSTNVNDVLVDITDEIDTGGGLPFDALSVGYSDLEDINLFTHSEIPDKIPETVVIMEFPVFMDVFIEYLFYNSYFQSGHGKILDEDEKL